jgi:uncharacterized protein with FMN-binding domain
VKRIVLWVLSTLSTVVVLFGYHTSTSSVMATSTGTTFSGSTGSIGSTGSVTGDTAQTRWGPVQVQLEVSGSTITHVSILQYPDGNGRDVEIANYALPQLIQDTLDSQGHSVSMVSGATYTSQGYLQSLQSALDRAGL